MGKSHKSSSSNETSWAPCDPQSSNLVSENADSSDKCYSLASSVEMGRFLLAARTIPAGEIIFKERPLVSAPNPLSEKLCFGCSAVSAECHTCPRCWSPLCSPQCPLLARHEGECSLLSKIAALPDEKRKQVRLSLLMLPLRCLLLRLQQPQQWQLLMDLESHVEKRRATPIWNVVEQKIAPYLQMMLGDQMPDLDTELVQKVCGIIDVNCFENRISTAGSGDSLRVVFSETSMINHSCVPNAQMRIDTDQTAIVRAQVEIREGEAICISYIDPLHTTLFRRTFLQKGKYFTCQCHRCQDPSELGTFLSAAVCLSCRKGSIVPHTQSGSLRWICSECQVEMEAAGRMEDVLHNVVKNIQKMPVDSALIERCEDLLLTLCRKLQPSHALVMEVKVHLMQLYGNVPGFLNKQLPVNLLERKSKLCTELLRVFDKICPGCSRSRGVTLYDFYQPAVYLARKKFESGDSTPSQLAQDLKVAEAALSEAVDILALEPESRPEAILYRNAARELNELKSTIQEVEEMKRSSS